MIKNTIFFLLLLSAGPGLKANEFACESTDLVENRRSSIPFKPFGMRDPQTGRSYHPQETLEIPLENGEISRQSASVYFNRLNEIEEALNTWGFSLRQEGNPTLARLNYCVSRLEAQKIVIQKWLRSKKAEFLESEDEWLERWQYARNEYLEDIPDWDELYRLADDENYEIYMPAVPVFQSPRPALERRPIEFSKEKRYSLYSGENKHFTVGVYPYYKAGADRLEARAEAGVEVTGSLVGSWKGEVAAVKLQAQSPGTGPLNLELVASVVDGRKTWVYPLVREGSLQFYDQVHSAVSKEVSYRFSLGPIPMLAQVGLRGEVGFKWGFDLYPLQIGAYTGPWAALDAYALVGADVVIGGLGVGGRLRMAEYSLMLQGNALFSWDDEPEVTLQVALTSDLTLLAGDLFAYAYIYYPVPWPPWKEKKSWNFSFFSWEGIRQSGTLFDYRARYNRAGLIAEGDLSAEDILEAEHSNRITWVENLEEIALESRDFVKNASEVLSGESTRGILLEVEKIKYLASQHDEMSDSSL